MTIAELREAASKYPDDWEVVRVNTTRGTVMALPMDHDEESDGSMARIAIVAACREWDVTPDDIKGKRRPMRFVMPRMAVYKVLLDHGISSSEAGRQLGKDHGSVLHGFKSCVSLLATDREYRMRYDRFVAFFEGVMERLSKSDCNPGEAGNNVVAS
jgi:chromosomal replication initiation ATPase DnaA